MEQALEATVQCSGCQDLFQPKQIEDHELQCPLFIRKCNIDSCFFFSTKDEFLSHLITSHSKSLLKNFDKNLASSSKSTYDLFVPLSKNKYDLLEPLTNSIGRKAWLGSTRKYYCGAKLNGSCGCCNGYCGPTNGCNCGPCMILDVESRRLPVGYWVNRQGEVCRKGRKGKVYCGNGSSFCKEESNCHSCQVMENTLDSRYFGVN